MVQPKITVIERRKGQGSHAQSTVALHAAGYHGHYRQPAFNRLLNIKLVHLELAWDELANGQEGTNLRVPDTGQSFQRLFFPACGPGPEVH